MALSARDTVYETLRARLTSGYYPEDVSLIPLPLSEEFEVSRTPVREALALLESDGLLISTQRGFVIRSRTDEEMLEIFEVRAILESSAAFAAAERRSPVDLARLDELARRARETSDPSEIRLTFNRLHDAIRRAAHNETISTLLRTLDAQVKVTLPWRPALRDDTFEDSYQEHEAIVAAIRAQDAESARHRMLEHLAHDRDNRISDLVSRMADLEPSSVTDR